jgi:hypothetical protein
MRRQRPYLEQLKVMRSARYGQEGSTVNLNCTKAYSPGGSGLLGRSAVTVAYHGSSTATGAPQFDVGCHARVPAPGGTTPVDEALELRARVGDLGATAVVDALMRLERLARDSAPIERDLGAPAEPHAREPASALAEFV